MTHFTGQDRKMWIGLLSRAESSEITSFFDGVDSLPQFSELRAPEIGMIMVRGRISGSGAPFNLGEMTVTRCSVLALGNTGHALVQGRRPEHARHAALADALLQDGAWFEAIRGRLIEPLRKAEQARTAERTADANGTRVDFFTMVRGEDEK